MAMECTVRSCAIPRRFRCMLVAHFQGPCTRRQLGAPADVVARERLAQRALPRVEGLGSSE